MIYKKSTWKNAYLVHIFDDYRYHVGARWQKKKKQALICTNTWTLNPL